MEVCLVITMVHSGHNQTIWFQLLSVEERFGCEEFELYNYRPGVGDLALTLHQLDGVSFVCVCEMVSKSERHKDKGKLWF